MYGFISGITDTVNIKCCPKCGEPITEHRGDGTVKCSVCRFSFGVVECEEQRKED